MTTWTDEKSVDVLKDIPDVEEVILQAHDRDTGYKAIVDKTSMNTICIVRQDHQFIQHSNVYKEIEKIDDYKIKNATLLQNGVMLSVDIVERTPRKVEFMPDDVLECGARITNSYDKNRGLSISGMAIRLVCTNGLVAPKLSKKMKVEAYGTNEFSNELRLKMQTCLEIWTDSAVSDLMKEAVKTTVSTKDVVEKYRILPKKQMEIVVSNLKDKETVYDIWNEYTRVITHEVVPIVKKEIVYQMQKRANTILKLAIIPDI